MFDNRFHRQELLFGREGQQALASLKVVIIGVGGTGSHVAQQLAYLGNESPVLIDRDLVTDTSRNRLIGSEPADVVEERPKVEVARRMIARISPTSTVTTISDSVISDAAFGSIEAADCVIGCVDRDSVRLVVNELCQAFNRPYLDIATDVERGNPKNFGGRLVFSVGGNGCVYCRGELDHEWIDYDFSSLGRRRDDEAIYGVSRSALGDVGPSVVSLNAILASLAVTELMAWRTGLRPPVPHLIYRGVWGTVIRSNEPPTPACYYCHGLRGVGKQANSRRFIDEGWGKVL